MVMWVFSQCSRIGRMEISLPAGSGCKKKRWNIWTQLSFAFTPQWYLALFSVDWECIEYRVDNLRVTCNESRPMNLQRKIQWKARIWGNSCLIATTWWGHIYCKHEKKSLKSPSIWRSQSYLSALGHLLFLQGKQLESTGMKNNVFKFLFHLWFLSHW